MVYSYQRIPPEIWGMITKEMSLCDCIHASHVCKSWNHIFLPWIFEKVKEKMQKQYPWMDHKILYKFSEKDYITSYFLENRGIHSSQDRNKYSISGKTHDFCFFNGKFILGDHSGLITVYDPLSHKKTVIGKITSERIARLKSLKNKIVVGGQKGSVWIFDEKFKKINEVGSKVEVIQEYQGEILTGHRDGSIWLHKENGSKEIIKADHQVLSIEVFGNEMITTHHSIMLNRICVYLHTFNEHGEVFTKSINQFMTPPNQIVVLGGNVYLAFSHTIWVLKNELKMIASMKSLITSMNIIEGKVVTGHFDGSVWIIEPITSKSEMLVESKKVTYTNENNRDEAIVYIHTTRHVVGISQNYVGFDDGEIILLNLENKTYQTIANGPKNLKEFEVFEDYAILKYQNELLLLDLLPTTEREELTRISYLSG